MASATLSDGAGEGLAGHRAHPMLYEINTRVLLRQIGDRLGRQAGFDDIPDHALNNLAQLGFDWIWLLGVWQTGAAARSISRDNPAWQDDYRHTLPDLAERDIAGSPFAIADYVAAEEFGGNAGLARLRERANRAGLRLMLDFVPNHMAPDHPWVRDHPDRFVAGTAADLQAQPQNWVAVPTQGPTETGTLVLAHGRDPYFPGWADTVQLDYSQPQTQAAMLAVLLDIAGRCDGLRCDMAMLLLPEIFSRTWAAHLHGRTVAPFWEQSLPKLRAAHPEFRLLAEVYWDLEATLLGQGFDHAYDKGLYDALRVGDAGRVRFLLGADPAHQAHLARFLENHDEPRAAASFELPRHRAAAVLSFCAPGLRLLHQGQLDGARVQISMHLDRGPVEAVDPGIHEFYLDLLAVLREPILRDGDFTPLAVSPAWEGNGSHAAFTASLWSTATGPRLLSVVNYRADRGQCRVRIAHPSLAGKLVALSDQLGPEHYSRDGNMIAVEGLYLDLPGYGYNLFAIDEPVHKSDLTAI